MPHRVYGAVALLLLSGVARSAAQDDERTRAVYRPVHIVGIEHDGAAEKATAFYNEWRANDRNRILLGDGVTFDKLSATQQQTLRSFMAKLYTTAGGGATGFKTVALLISKGLQEPSADFTGKNYSADPIPQ